MPSLSKSILTPSSLTFLILYVLLQLSTFSNAKVTFLTNTYPPFSDCTQYSPEIGSSSVFGAEVELLRSALLAINWIEDTDYSFKCTFSSTRDLIRTFLNSTANQTGVLGGIAISASRLQRNRRFSQPTASAPLHLIYKKTPKGWFFRRSLDMVTWAILAATVAMMGGILYFLENKEAAYINMLYNAFCQFFLQPDYPLSYFPSKLANYFSTFLVATFVIAFTAVSTNIFDSDRNFGNLVSLEKLSNSKVHSNYMLEDYLVQSGVKLTSIDNIDSVDFVNKIDELDVNYLVVDGPYGDFLVRQRCDLYNAQNEIDLIHYGVMFQSAFSRDTINRISRGLYKSKDIKSFDQYVSEYYSQKSDLQTCKNKAENEHQSVTFYETRGLWYILAIGMGIGVGFAGLDIITNFVKKNLQIYGLQGVRSRMDGKVQRRVATILAIHAGVSVQTASFFKKLCLEPMDKHLSLVKAKISLPTIIKTFQQVKKRPQGVMELHSRDFSTLRNRTSSRGPTLISWLKKAGSEKNVIRKKNTSPNLGILSVNKITSSKSEGGNLVSSPISNEDNSGRESEESKRALGREILLKSLEKSTRRNESKRSSYLIQSAKKYQLDKSLHLRLGTLFEGDLESNQNASDKESNSQVVGVQTPKATTPKEQAVENKNTKKLRIIAKGLAFIERMFGKKGLKKNKKIKRAATTLIAQKQAMLHQEIEKKKAEVVLRSSILSPRSSLKKSVNLTPEGSPSARNETINPSKFKLKYMSHQSGPLGPIGDSPKSRFRNYSPRNPKGDSIRLDGFVSPKGPIVHNFGMSFQDYVAAAMPAMPHKIIPSGIVPKSLSMVGKDLYEDEDYNFGTQYEGNPEVVVSSCSNLEMYNFSQIIKQSPSGRELLRKEDGW